MKKRNQRIIGIYPSLIVDWSEKIPIMGRVDLAMTQVDCLIKRCSDLLQIKESDSEYEIES